MVSHCVLLVTWRDHWDQRDNFLLASDSQYPHSMPGRLRVGFGMSWPFSDSLLGYSLRNCKILTLQKAWPKYKLGGSQKMVSEWHNSFCQKQRKDSEFPYVHSFKALSPNPDLRDSCHMCLSVVSLSPVPFCFFPSDFQMTPTRPFIST